MQQTQGAIIQQNMQNPQIQAMYQQYRNNGGPMSFEQFVYNYAATAGFTSEGTARWNQNERNIQQQENQAIQQYRQSQQDNAAALQQTHERNAEIAHQRGNLLNGTTDYVNPQTGGTYNLPHTVQPNTYYSDPSTGETFYNDPQGNYHRERQDGYSEELEEDE